MKRYYSHGKLLLTGEYLVLDGALSLGIPTRPGQDLKIQETTENNLIWKSYDLDGNCWLAVEFELPRLRIISADYVSEKERTHETLAETLAEVLLEIKRLNPDVFSGKTGLSMSTKLEFPRHWGLGTSSSLINNLANWSGVDAYELLGNTFGGSGYDLACAQHDVPVLFRKEQGRNTIKEIDFNPSFKNQLFFVYLNKKQNSRDGISHYKNIQRDLSLEIQEVSDLTSEILSCANLGTFESLLDTHEQLISSVIGLNPVQSVLFPDYFGKIKSLGAWGGDFILATGNADTPNYFNQKGFSTVISYKDMVL